MAVTAAGHHRLFPTWRARPSHKRRWPLVVLAALLAVPILWLAVDALLAHQARSGLSFFTPLYELDWKSSGIQPGKFNFALNDVTIVKPTAGGRAKPYIAVRKLEVNLARSEWLHGRFVSEVVMTGLQVNLISAADPERRQLEPGIDDFMQKLQDSLPFEADRVVLKDASITFTSKDKTYFPVVRLSKIDGTLESLAPESAKARGAPTTIALSGTLQSDGAVSVFLTADPLEKERFFAGRIALERFDLSQIKHVMAKETGLAVERGELDLAAVLECRDGQLKGGVRPTFRDTKVVPGKPGIDHAISALVVDGALKALNKDDDGRVSKVIPIRGDLDAPGFQAWPLVAGVLKNAFKAGVDEGLRRASSPRKAEEQK